MTQPTIAIRRATTADWAGIWPIWHEVVAAGETYTWDPHTDEATAQTLWLPPPPAETWVAVDGATIAGTALLKPNQPGLGAHVANASFMVPAASAGQGIGRRLAEHLLAHAATSGYLAMQFNAVVSTNEPAVALWQALGFDIVGTIPEGFHHARLGYVDLYVMYRKL